MEWLLSKTLRGRGALIPAFAQVLERAGLLAVLHQYDRQLRSFGRSFTDPFIVCSDRDPGSPPQVGSGQAAVAQMQ